ncbi:hypothetical protein H3Z83_05850 [Tenacibaculum sp. S7007]|uniref:Lipoprotein n=1 Tax=Tenacibaculum pelagium TaxID=2759527 RepID=A0A839ALN7_9FLAO|nr:hypothetical protein [Tenacibaculum pelagium]MBA6156042.1 hypothetical protein [Tenacibaculum pelagium]
MKKTYLLLLIISLCSCVSINQNTSNNNEPPLSSLKSNSELDSYYTNLKLLMNKNYYYVHRVFNTSEFEDSKNKIYKNLSRITKNEFEAFLTKSNFKNFNEFKNFFNQFKPISHHKNKFDEKTKKKLTKIENMLDSIINFETQKTRTN